MSMKRIFKYWSPVIFWMGFIFWMSTGTFSSDNTSAVIEPLLLLLMPWLSSQRLDVIHEIIRKCAHLTEYFVLGLLLFRAFRSGSSPSRMLRWTLSAGIVVLLYAASDEFHQSFVGSRTPALHDVVIDVAGGVLAQGAAILYFRLKSSSRI